MKYKVGDRVKIRDGYYKSSYVGDTGTVMTAQEYSDCASSNAVGIKFDIYRDSRHGMSGKVTEGYGWYVNVDYLEPLVPNHKIVITADGKTTLARLYEGKRVIKSAEAKCAPGDTYNFNIGANLSYNRLMFGTDYHPDEVKLNPVAPNRVKPGREPVKLYCVKDYNGIIKRGDIGRFDPGEKGVVFGHIKLGIIPGANTFAEWQSQNPGRRDYFVPLVKRPAKVGEWVYIEHKIGRQTYKTGDIGAVEKVAVTHPSDVFAFENQYVDCTEYLVLDGYDGRYEEIKK